MNKKIILQKIHNNLTQELSLHKTPEEEKEKRVYLQDRSKNNSFSPIYKRHNIIIKVSWIWGLYIILATRSSPKNIIKPLKVLLKFGSARPDTCMAMIAQSEPSVTATEMPP